MTHLTYVLLHSFFLLITRTVARGKPQPSGIAQFADALKGASRVSDVADMYAEVVAACNDAWRHGGVGKRFGGGELVGWLTSDEATRQRIGILISTAIRRQDAPAEKSAADELAALLAPPEDDGDGDGEDD